MKRWICSQLGAREHFAIPRALSSIGLLDQVFTDLRRRNLEMLPSHLVTTFPVKGAIWWWKLRSSPNYQAFVKQGEWFSRAVASRLNKPSLEDSIFFGYDTGFLEAAEMLSQRGAKTVVGQMDPGRFEFDLVEKERQRWPGWEKAIQVPESYHERREQEWNAADRILVNSQWTKKALIQQGVENEKIRVIPLCYEPTELLPRNKDSSPSKRLEVLWLGQVILRKGIPYLLEAARLLPPEKVRFTVVGPIGISPTVVSKAPENVRFVGPVPRGQVPQFYESADVFLLPTLSDGFAITQIEAMAYGLPVIATPCCGEVVTDGKDGFLIPPRSPEDIATRLQDLLDNPDLRVRMSANAKEKAEDFRLTDLATHLAIVEE